MEQAAPVIHQAEASGAIEAFGGHTSAQYRIGTAQALASVENFDELEEVQADLMRFFKLALARLGGPRVARVEVQTYDMAPTDSFEELRDTLARSLIAPAQRLAEVVGKPPSDAGWVMEFLGGDPRITMRFGPMKAEQIKKLLRDQRDDSYPEQCLFLDLDYVHAGEDLDADQAPARLSACVESNRRLLRRAADWLTGALNA